MTLFYAYARHCLPIVTLQTSGGVRYRPRRWPDFLLAFAARINPHYYIHDRNKARIADTVTTDNVAKKFLGKVFFTLLNDRGGRDVNIIPPLRITDHISGNWFYIRSKDNNSVYWYAAPDTQIVASRTQSTRFRISTVDKKFRGKVMVRDDKVYITQGGNISLHVSETGGLQSGGKPEASFRFGDLIDGFRINAYGNETLVDVSANAIVMTKENDAEEWELTNSGLFGDLD